MRMKFDRAKVFAEVDASNLRFESYTKAQRRAFWDGFRKRRSRIWERMFNKRHNLKLIKSLSK